MSEGRLYCAAIAFLLHKEPFVQGITSARDIGETVGRAILSDIADEKTPLFQISAETGSPTRMVTGSARVA